MFVYRKTSKCFINAVTNTYEICPLFATCWRSDRAQTGWKPRPHLQTGDNTVKTILFVNVFHTAARTKGCHSKIFKSDTLTKNFLIAFLNSGLTHTHPIVICQLFYGLMLFRVSCEYWLSFETSSCNPIIICWLFCSVSDVLPSVLCILSQLIILVAEKNWGSQLEICIQAYTANKTLISASSVHTFNESFVLPLDKLLIYLGNCTASICVFANWIDFLL